MRIAFLCESNWSVNSVYEGLSKELYKHDIDTYIYHWSWSHKENKQVSHITDAEWFKIINNYDYIVGSTGPEFVDYYNQIGLPPEKTILVIHAPWEIPRMHKEFGDKCLERFAGVFSISGDCIEGGKKLGITTDVSQVQNGILFNRYYAPPSERFVDVGYGYPVDTHHKWKRTHIIPQVNGGVSVPGPSATHYTLMRKFYHSIDSSLWVSTEAEACGLVNMEAAAAGRLVMSTDVGIIRDLPDTPIVKLRMPEEETLEDIHKYIRFYKKWPELHHKKCVEIQEYAREYYDWSYAVKSWLTALDKL